MHALSSSCLACGEDRFLSRRVFLRAAQEQVDQMANGDWSSGYALARDLRRGQWSDVSAMKSFQDTCHGPRVGVHATDTRLPQPLHSPGACGCSASRSQSRIVHPVLIHARCRRLLLRLGRAHSRDDPSAGSTLMAGSV